MSSIVGIGETEHLRTHALKECLKTRREKYAVPPDVALERRTKRVIPGFRPVRSLLDAVGPSLLSATDLASRYGIEGGICRPLNHMRQIPRLVASEVHLLKAEGAFTRQSKNGAGPTKTGTVPTVFTKKQ